MEVKTKVWSASGRFQSISGQFTLTGQIKLTNEWQKGMTLGWKTLDTDQTVILLTSIQMLYVLLYVFPTFDNKKLL